MELTAVERIRERHRNNAQFKAMRLALLREAAAFQAWLDKTGMRASFLAFCDDYGAHMPQRKAIYRNIRKLLNLANDRVVELQFSVGPGE